MTPSNVPSSQQSSQITIAGDAHLSGVVPVAGSKNAFHKLIAACIALPAVHHLRGVPQTEDARSLVAITKALGAEVTLDTYRSVLTLDSTRVHPEPLASSLTRHSTGSFLFAGALLGRFGLAEVGAPGGDEIGSRPVDRHLDAFQSLGATIEQERSGYRLFAEPLTGGLIRFERDTVNGTANAILAAVGAQGSTTIEGASIDPDVLTLIDFLRRAGVSIETTSPGSLHIVGRETTVPATSYAVPPDRNDAATLAIAGALCGGEVEIVGIGREPIGPLIAALELAGVPIDSTTSSLVVHGNAWHGGGALQLTSGPYPDFLTDWGPLVQVFMTRLSGRSTFHETVYSARFSHVAELAHMGAVVSLDDTRSTAAYGFTEASPGGQVVQIEGPTRLHGTAVTGDNLRASAALLIAGLIADGHTTLRGSEHLVRGYDNLIKRIRDLGADIAE